MDLLHLGSKEKRRSLNNHLSSVTKRNVSKEDSTVVAVAPAKLSIDYESPPIIFYGNTHDSTGAILSGQLELDVTDTETRLTTFEMVLLGIITTKKPVVKDCVDCQTTTTQIQKWVFLSEPSRFNKGRHSFPFSYLLPGHLPTTSNGSLGSIRYTLKAHAMTSYSENIDFSRALTVQRAQMPRPDRTCLRCFAPTNITVSLTLPSIIHPIGTFPVQIRLDGILGAKGDTQVRYIVQKMSWCIDESCTIISPACHKHERKIGSGDDKGILHQDRRFIGGEDIKDGWKTDYEIPGGQVEHEFGISIRQNGRYVCDVKSATGFEVTHSFTFEVAVAEYHFMVKNPKYAIPTGNVRILRTLSKQILTERSGMGIAWDEEQPPVYNDVPLSPPRYAIEHYQDEPISYEDLNETRQWET